MRRRITILAIGALIGLTASIQNASARPATPIERSPETRADAPSTGESTVIEAASFEPVPVPEPTEKAMRYYRSGNHLWLVTVCWELLLPALFLFTGFSARIRDWARALGKNWFFTIAVYFIIFTAIVFVIDLPLYYYRGYVRPHAFDLSNQTLAKWVGDMLKHLLVNLVAGVATLWVPYLLLRKSPRRWWLYTGILTVPFVFVLILVEPVVIAPLYNEFTPMEDRQLEAKILDLADRAGIEGGRVYEVDKSVDTKALIAYVSGFLNTKRVVLGDTMIARMEEHELLFVVGHEMGHYVLRHMVTWFIVFSAIILVSLYVAHKLSEGMLRRFRRRFRFDKLYDVASLPLIVLLMNLFLLVMTPVALGFSRHLEHEADRYGLELTRNNRAAATAFVKLQYHNLGNPRPGLVYKLWRASHPTLGERIDFCNTYRPWQTGQPLVYADRIKD